MKSPAWKSALSPLIGISLLFAIWEVGVRVTNVSVFLLPPPSRILQEIWTHGPVLLRHSLSTLGIILTGFGLSALVGIPLALAVSFSPLFRRTVYPMLVFSQLVPKIALAPLFVIWLGFGFLPKVLIAFLLSFFAVVLQSVVGFTSIRPEQIRVARSMGATGATLFFKVRLPQALPNIFAGLKLAMASSAIGAIVGEFIASQRGLGYLVLVANGEMNTPMSFAGMLLLTLMGIVLYFAVEAVERLTTGWHVSQRVNPAL
jgi:NitT/TauT family transport system permease protein